MNAKIAAKFMILVITGLVFHANCVAQQSSVPQKARQACAGTGPYPCARTDLAVQQESPLPFTGGLGGYSNMPAGTIFKDPDFGERTLRVTDVNTLPSCFNTTAWNSALVGPDNPDLSIFSSDENWFRVADLNGSFWLYRFDPATMTATCAPTSTSSLHNLPWAPVFGHTQTDAGIAFGSMGPSTGTPWIAQRLDVTNPANTPSNYYDFSTCAGMGWLSTLPIKTMQWFPGVWLSNDDNRIMWTFGPMQNEGWISAIYDRAQNECAWVDTRTGRIGGSLAATGTMTGAFPLDWGSTRAPSAPVVAQTSSSSGTLTVGHTYDVCYSLVWETNEEGVGETSCSAVQRIAITSGNSAISTPSPEQCATHPNCDIMTWNYYNVYVNDEANCGRAQCAESSLYLQPAANLGCTQPLPTISIAQAGSPGSTTYSYAAEAYGPHCMTFVQGSTSAGAAALSGTNYNIVTPGAAAGANWYRIDEGGKGNADVWSSTTYGTASVDAASPSGGGTAMFPASVRDGTSLAAVNDQGIGNSGLALEAMGTIPCYDNMPEGAQWSQLFTLTSSSALYNCDNNTVLTALTTSGPTAPTKSTLGVGMHAAIMSRDGSAVLWGSDPNSGSNVLWLVGSTVSTLCNVDPNVEYPTADSYTPCGGHGLMGAQTVANNQPLIGGDPNFSFTVRTFENYPSIASNIFGIATFPALDPKGFDYYDQHESWNANRGTDADAPVLFSTDTGSSALLSAFQGPLYIGRGLAREIYTMNPNGTFSRFAHHRASGVPYYTTAICKYVPGGCEQYGYESQAAMSDDGHWALYTSDMESSLGCDPTQTFPITAVTLGNPATITISIPAGNAANTPLNNQVGTVLGTTGVTGLNAQWTLAGTSPNFTLIGSNLSGTVGSLTQAQFQECTYNAKGQVNGPAPASTCGTGSQACKTGKSLRSVFITGLK